MSTQTEVLAVGPRAVRLRPVAHRPLVQLGHDQVTAPKSEQRGLMESRVLTTPLQMGLSGTYAGGIEAHIWNFTEIDRVTDTESIVARGFEKKEALCMKEGFSFVSANAENSKYIERRMREIAWKSSTTVGSYLRHAIRTLNRYSNGLYILVRNESHSTGEHATYKGRDYAPIAGMFVADISQFRAVVRKRKIIRWQYLTAQGIMKQFEPHNVILFARNRRSTSIYGTPDWLAVLNDVRALRQLEDYANMYVDRHLFPLLQYKVGTEKAPAKIQPDGLSEVELVENKTGDLFSEGTLFTSERHTVEVIAAKSTVDVATFMEYYKKRVIMGLGMSPVDLGEGGTANRGCHDEQTQTLTEHGWRYYWEIDYTKDKLATLNPDTGEIEYHVSDGLWLERYVGKMHAYKSATADIMVTPDHTMWVGHKKLDGGSYWKREKSEAIKVKHPLFKTSASWSGDVGETIQIPYLPYAHNTKSLDVGAVSVSDKMLAEFLGYFVTEGCLSRMAGKSQFGINIDQNRGAKYDKISACMDAFERETKIRVRRRPRTDGCERFFLSNKSLYAYLESCGHMAPNKRLPPGILSLRREALEVLFDAMMLGDGTRDARPNRNCCTFYSTSVALCDQMQELCLKLGHRSIMKLHKPAEGNRHARYRVQIVLNSDATQLYMKDNRSEVDYDGMVYCYRVKNHLFVTRRNGHVTIQGNTATTISRGLIDICKAMQDEAAEQFTHRIIFPLLLEAGIDPLDPEESVELKFHDIDTEEKRAKEDHNANMFNNDAISHDEMRQKMGHKPMTEEERKAGTYTHTTHKERAEHAETASAEAKAANPPPVRATAARAKPTNQHGSKVKPKTAKNDEELDQLLEDGIIEPS